MNERVGKLLKYGISLLLAAALLYFAFHQVSWSEFWTALKACRWEFVVLSMLFGLLAFFLRALRWRELLLPIDSSTQKLTCFNAINISYVVNLVLPRVGEFIRCGYITAHSKKDPSAQEGENRKLASYDKVLGTAALERSADIIAMAVVMGIFLLCTWKKYGDFFSEKIFGAAAGGFSVGKLAVALGLVLLAVAAVACVFIFADRWKPLAKIAGFCKGLWKGFVSCLHMKRAWWFFLLTAFIWGCYWMMSASILWAVQGISPEAVGPEMASIIENVQGLNLTDALFLMLAGSISSIVPVPGGFGAFHFIVAGALTSVYGVPFDFGMIFATLSHESQTINQLFWGAISWISESTRKK